MLWASVFMPGASEHGPGAPQRLLFHGFAWRLRLNDPGSLFTDNSRPHGALGLVTKGKERYVNPYEL